jgi:methionyl aminopeptidase
VTSDGSLSAQFEHTVVVTKSGCEVLTRGEASNGNSARTPSILASNAI